jgi:PilZ domain
MHRRRRQHRVPVDIALALIDDGGNVTLGRVTDLSVGGVRVETDSPPAFGSRVEARLRLPGSARELSLPAVVRWTLPGVAGLQFGLLGVRETHLITALTTESSQTLGSQDVAWIG